MQCSLVVSLLFTASVASAATFVCGSNSNFTDCEDVLGLRVAVWPKEQNLFDLDLTNDTNCSTNLGLYVARHAETVSCERATSRYSTTVFRLYPCARMTELMQCRNIKAQAGCTDGLTLKRYRQLQTDLLRFQNPKLARCFRSLDDKDGRKESTAFSSVAAGEHCSVKQLSAMHQGLDACSVTQLNRLKTRNSSRDASEFHRVEFGCALVHDYINDCLNNYLPSCHPETSTQHTSVYLSYLEVFEMDLRTSINTTVDVIQQCFPVLAAFLDHHMVQDNSNSNNSNEAKAPEVTTTPKPMSEKDKKLLELLEWAAQLAAFDAGKIRQKIIAMNKHIMANASSTATPSVKAAPPTRTLWLVLGLTLAVLAFVGLLSLATWFYYYRLNTKSARAEETSVPYRRSALNDDDDEGMQETELRAP